MDGPRYTGLGFVTGIFLYLGVNPVGVVIDSLVQVVKNLRDSTIMTGGLVFLLLVILYLYKIQNQVEPVFNAFEAYQHSGEWGILAFISAFLSGITILKFQSVGVFLLIMAMFLEMMTTY